MAIVHVTLGRAVHRTAIARRGRNSLRGSREWKSKTLAALYRNALKPGVLVASLRMPPLASLLPSPSFSAVLPFIPRHSNRSFFPSCILSLSLSPACSPFSAPRSFSAYISIRVITYHSRGPAFESLILYIVAFFRDQDSTFSLSGRCCL